MSAAPNFSISSLAFNNSNSMLAATLAGLFAH